MSNQNYEPASIEQLATWKRERSPEELHNFLGGKMAEIALENIDDTESSLEDAGAYDLMTAA